WPTSTWASPVLRGLDERARREIEGAGTLHSLADEQFVYRAGDGGDSFFVVATGKIALRATRRGEADESELRLVDAGDAFGEEAVVGARRAGTAAAHGAALVAEVPVHVFRRAAKRSAGGDVADRLERTLRRSAARDLLRTSAL